MENNLDDANRQAAKEGHKEQEEQELRLSAERYKAIFEQSPMGIAITDSITRQMFKANAKFCEICGRTIDEMNTIDWAAITHPDDLQEDLARTQEMRERKTDGFQMNKRFIKPDGSNVWISMTIAPIRFEGEKPCHLCMIEDITEKKERDRRIEFLSYHDMLTGLYNRAFFEETIERYDNEKYFPLTIMTGDVNGLKLINDTLGHAEGDKVLVEIARLMEACIRKTDILSRVGGDEFSILMPGTTPEEARMILDCIYDSCRRYRNTEKKDLEFLSISLGYATKTMGTEPFENIEKIAEDHMYKRKLLEHKRFYSTLISSMKTTLFEKSNETREHTERLASMSRKIGILLHLSEEQLTNLVLLSRLHDIGKISIDDEILTKPASLTDKEWLEMRKHPDIGYRIAMASPELEPIAEYILSHHERWDGKGYPQGLKGEEIPLPARIISVIDAYDAMTENRPYRKAFPVQYALDEIMMNAGTQFDPMIATLFVNMMNSKNEGYHISRNHMSGNYRNENG